MYSLSYFLFSVFRRTPEARMEDQLTEASSCMSAINVATTTDRSTGASPDNSTALLPLQEATRRMLIFFSAIILLSGVFGNVMILLILGRLKSSGSSMDIFFRALAVSDSILLIATSLREVLEGIFDTDFYSLHSVVCKFFIWMLYVTGVLSPWLLVAMTAQRAMSVVWPLRVKVLCTRKKSKLVLLALILLIMLLHAHALYGNDVFMDCGEEICSMDLYYGDFLTDIWSWVDLIIFSLLPFLLLIGSNTIMIWKLTSFVKNARIALSSGQSDPATIRNSRASSLTLTLIFLSITFLFLTMPYSIFLILYDTLDNKIEDEYDLSIFSFLCAFFSLTVVL